MKKYLVIPIPFVTVWISFALGHVLGMTESQWWAVPYIVTSTGAVVCSIIFTITAYDKLGRRW